MKGKEENASKIERKKLTDEELEKVSGGATVIPKKDALSKDGVTKPDLKSALQD